MKSLGCNEPQLQKRKTHPGFSAALDQSGGGTTRERLICTVEDLENAPHG